MKEPLLSGFATVFGYAAYATGAVAAVLVTVVVWGLTVDGLLWLWRNARITQTYAGKLAVWVFSQGSSIWLRSLPYLKAPLNLLLLKRLQIRSRRNESISVGNEAEPDRMVPVNETQNRM